MLKFCKSIILLIFDSGFFILAYGKNSKLQFYYIVCGIGTKKLITIYVRKLVNFGLKLNFLGSKYRMFEPKISEQGVAVRSPFTIFLTFLEKIINLVLANGVVIGFVRSIEFDIYITHLY